MSPKRWVRTVNGPIGGVCGGLAKALGINELVFRLLWIVGTVCYGLTLWTYLLLWWLLPREDKQYEPESPIVLGVCIRLAQRLGWEVGPVRVLTVISPFITFGTAAVIYLVLHLLLPKSAAEKVN